MTRIAALIGAFMLLTACNGNIISLDDYTRYAIGRPVAEKASLVKRSTSYASRIGWKETAYPLENGNWVYIEPDRLDTFIHWEVNPRGMIVGYAVETVGKGETTKGKDFRGEFKHPSVTNR